MRRWLIRRFIAAFERRYDYDMSYARELVDVSPRAFARFNKVVGMAKHREEVPLEAWFAAKLAATRAEDCGPCTQLTVRMAEEAGVSPAVLRAVLSDDEVAMGADARLGYRYAVAALAHHQSADALREEVLCRYGQRGLISLAFALSVTRLFPTLKYALGHGHACERIEVAGQPVAIGARRAARR